MGGLAHTPDHPEPGPASRARLPVRLIRPATSQRRPPARHAEGAPPARRLARTRARPGGRAGFGPAIEQRIAPRLPRARAPDAGRARGDASPMQDRPRPSRIVAPGPAFRAGPAGGRRAPAPTPNTSRGPAGAQAAPQAQPICPPTNRGTPACPSRRGRAFGVTQARLCARPAGARRLRPGNLRRTPRLPRARAPGDDPAQGDASPMQDRPRPFRIVASDPALEAGSERAANPTFRPGAQTPRRHP